MIVGVIVFLVIIMSNTSVQSGVYAADPGEKPFSIAYMTMTKLKRYVVTVRMTI